MSTYKVPITTIREIHPHGNADKLVALKIYDFDVVASKDKYREGERVLFIPPDSVLPQKIENALFPEGSKIKLNKHRVKQIRIRGRASQGMIADLGVISDVTGVNLYEMANEMDLSEVLGISKYEPPLPDFQRVGTPGKPRDKSGENPSFHKYHGLNNVKWFPDLFEEGEEVVLQEKLHGSLCRASLLPYQANTIWRKIKKFFNLVPQFEFLYGSNNVQISGNGNYKGFYGEDVYGQVLKRVGAESKIRPNEIIYGELIGTSIQKGYDYGHKDHHHFVLFDVKVMNFDGSFKWLNPEEVEAYAKERGFTMVPILYRGPYNKQMAYALTKGDSVYCPSQKIREGIVIKSRYALDDTSCEANKKALKWLSEEYLDSDQTDFH